MAEITTVEVIYGKLKATIKLSYRWYVAGSDPWESSDRSCLVPSRGYWFDTYPYVVSGDRELYDTKGRHVITFKNFDRTKKWSAGDGTFVGNGATYNIPKGAKIKWLITNVN